MKLIFIRTSIKTAYLDSLLLLMASDGRFYDLHHLNTFCSGNWDFFSVKNGLVHSLKKSIVIALFCGHEFFDNSSIAFGVE